MEPISFESRILGTLEMVKIYNTDGKLSVHITDPQDFFSTTIFSGWEGTFDEVTMEILDLNTDFHSPRPVHKVDQPGRFGAFGTDWIKNFYRGL